MNLLLKRVLTLVVAGMLSISCAIMATGCESEGPVEEAAEETEEAAEEAADETEEAVDEVDE